MELASLNSDMALACEIKHDDKLTDEDGVYIQVEMRMHNGTPHFEFFVF